MAEMGGYFVTRKGVRFSSIEGLYPPITDINVIPMDWKSWTGRRQKSEEGIPGDLRSRKRTVDIDVFKIFRFALP
jgi:hypothetical protein